MCRNYENKKCVCPRKHVCFYDLENHPARRCFKIVPRAWRKPKPEKEGKRGKKRST